jgi:hypothetical protein
MSKPKRLEILICSRCGRPGSVFNLPGSICDGDHHTGDWQRCMVDPNVEEYREALNKLAQIVYGEGIIWTSANALVENAIRAIRRGS